MKRLLALLAIAPAALLFFHGHANAAERALTRIEFLDYVLDEVYPADAARNCFQDIAPSLPPKYTKLFADVAVTDTFADEVCLGMLFGLIDGNWRNEFRPQDSITLAEAAKIVSQAYGISLPDSEKIRSLPWHWRYTEAFKRRGVLARSYQNYGRTVTASDLDAMLTALHPAKPKLTQRAAQILFPGQIPGRIVEVRGTNSRGVPVTVRVTIIRTESTTAAPVTVGRSRGCEKIQGRRCVLSAEERRAQEALWARARASTSHPTIGNYHMRLMKTWEARTAR